MRDGVAIARTTSSACCCGACACIPNRPQCQPGTPGGGLIVPGVARYSGLICSFVPLGEPTRCCCPDQSDSTSLDFSWLMRDSHFTNGVLEETTTTRYTPEPSPRGPLIRFKVHSIRKNEITGQVIAESTDYGEFYKCRFMEFPNLFFTAYFDCAAIITPTFGSAVRTCDGTSVSIAVEAGVPGNPSLITEFRGYARLYNPECRTGTCQLGACCLDDGTCIMTNGGECAAAGGSFSGLGTACVDGKCPSPRPRGACCKPDGTCALLTESQCAAADGTYQGDDIECATVTCPPPESWACCLPGGICLDKTNAACLAEGGTWYPGQLCVNVECDPQPPTGACCLPGGGCQELTGQACIASNGTWRGGGTTCATENCDETGACCHQGAHGFWQCTQETFAQCSVLGNSVWYGAGVACSSVPCPPARPAPSGSGAFL
jgi:hypothetical protein